MIVMPTASTAKSGAAAHAVSASAVTASSPTARGRRLAISPTGTSSAIPAV
jgi:hypothetical protein